MKLYKRYKRGQMKLYINLRVKVSSDPTYSDPTYSPLIPLIPIGGLLIKLSVWLPLCLYPIDIILFRSSLTKLIGQGN